MKKRKYAFNMVEVALALLVISLGLSTVLTLFPAGLKATRESENANNLVEAAEYVFAYLQTLVNDKANDLDEIKTAGVDNSTYGVTNSKVRLEKRGDGTYVYHKSVALTDSSGYTEDFSCVVRILDAEKGLESGTSDDAVIPLPVSSSGGGDFEIGSSPKYYFKMAKQNDSVGGSQISSIIKVVNVELSYPASASYGNRTKRVFRMVFLSHNYAPHPEE